MAVTVRVHGSITIANTSRSSTAGTPVWFRLATSGPDQNAGYAATLKATGPAHRRLDELDRPGHRLAEQVRRVQGHRHRHRRPRRNRDRDVHLDAPGGPHAGTAGTVKQVGGSARCLDDPSGKTANGTNIQLWSCTGKSNQNWTAVQDGTLRTGGKCLQTIGNSTAGGAKLELEPCNVNDGLQMWEADTDGQLVNPQSGKCLATGSAPTASVANGTKPVIEPCANSTSEALAPSGRRPRLRRTRQVRRYLGHQGGAGHLRELGLAALAAADRRHHPHQRLVPGGKRIHGRSTVSLASCSAAGVARSWKIVSACPIATELVNTASGLCAADPASGTQLVIAACANSATTTWHLE